MRKIYPTLFNKFAVFILYGLLLVAAITLAQQGNNNGGDGAAGEAVGGAVGTIPSSPTSQPSPKMPPISDNKCLPPLPSGQKKMIIGYVQQPKNIDPTTIQWDYYNYINVIASFGQNPNLPTDMSFLSTFTQAKKQNTTKILLSIRNFDPGMWPTDEPSYKSLADTLINTTTIYNLSGIDIEYPGMRGRYCNGAWDPSKDQPFVGFLTYLHNQQLNNKKILMLTGGNDAVVGLDARSIDIDILNIETFHYSFYDNYNNNNNPPPEGKVKTDPNAPFNAYSAAYDKWHVTGIDDSKIAMGVDLGNTFQVVDNRDISTKQSVLTGIYDPGANGLNDYSYLDPITYCPYNDKLKLYSFTWKQLIEANILSPTGDAQCYNLKVDPGWQNHADPLAYTSWLTRATQNQKFLYYVSYEDFNSLSTKLNSTLGKLIGGISIFDVTDDTNGAYSLVNYMQSIRIGQSTSQNPTPTGNQPPQGNDPSGVSPSSPDASTNNSQNEENRKPGVIAGAVIGSIFGLAIIGGIAFFGYKNRDKLPFGQNQQYSKNMSYNQGTFMNQPGTIIPNNSPRMVLPDTAAIPVAPSYVTAMFDFIGKEENDLSFKKGDKIEVLERGDGPNDWWVGRVNGAVGEFPGNYVRE